LFALNHFLKQESTTNSKVLTKKYKSFIRVIVGAVGIVLTVIEVLCYVLFFYHIYKHNQTVASQVLEPSIIKKRNKRNAISMTGQLAGWIMEGWHVVLIGFLTPIFDLDSLRNVSSLLKNFEFAFIPLVQIWSSVPIKKYLLKSNE
jgi:hypothetical protein